MPLTIAALAAMQLVLSACVARGHDIPDERVDRGIQLRLEPPMLRVSYEVSLSDWTLFQDLKRLSPELPAAKDAGDRVEGYARLVAPLNARGLLARVDDSDLSWEFDRFEVDFEQHVLLTFHYKTTIPGSGRLWFRDTNYESSYGSSRLALSVSPGTTMNGYEGPAVLADVPEVPVWAMTDAEEVGSKQVEVDYRSLDLPALAVAAESADPDPNRTARRAESGGGKSEARVDQNRLTRMLLDPSGRTAPLLLIAALVIGAAHAVQPGHGKTLVVGASLPGDRPIGRGLLLAATAAVSHFAVAVGLAIVAILILPRGFDRIDAILTRGIGLLIGIVGAWRIGAALSRPEPDEERSGRRVETTRDAILAGLAIGAIPCWDAVLLLALAWVAGQALFGLALLVAFSIGASATLLGVALLAGLFRTIATRLTAAPLLERSLGMAGGLFLAGVGSYLFLA